MTPSQRGLQAALELLKQQGSLKPQREALQRALYEAHVQKRYVLLRYGRVGMLIRHDVTEIGFAPVTPIRCSLARCRMIAQAVTRQDPIEFNVEAHH